MAATHSQNHGTKKAETSRPTVDDVTARFILSTYELHSRAQTVSRLMARLLLFLVIAGMGVDISSNITKAALAVASVLIVAVWVSEERRAHQRARAIEDIVGQAAASLEDDIWLTALINLSYESRRIQRASILLRTEPALWLAIVLLTSLLVRTPAP